MPEAQRVRFVPVHEPDADERGPEADIELVVKRDEDQQKDPLGNAHAILRQENVGQPCADDSAEADKGEERSAAGARDVLRRHAGGHCDVRSLAANGCAHPKRE